MALHDRFKGEPIWIVCTGTSMRGFDFSWLADQVTVAVNDAIFFFTPTIHILNDSKVARRCLDRPGWNDPNAWNRHPCCRPPGWGYAEGQMVATRNKNVKIFSADQCGKRIQLYRWEHAGPKITMKYYELYCRCTTATAAFQLAVRLGASWIGILGADCYRRGNARYFWEPFSDSDSIQFQGTDGGGGDYAKDWRDMRAWRDQRHPDVRVVNYSPKSPCQVWEHKDDWRNVFPLKEVTHAG